jgi:hypothetical protein
VTAQEIEQHRRECEARYIFAMDGQFREEFYRGALKERGKARVNQLIADVNELRKKARETMK